VLAELSVEQREPLILAGKGYSSQEIAGKLKISDDAARQRTSRAMRYVRNRFQDLGL
jgi:DNA-directed RNA polymerase specialized sigma24 family protein